MKNRNLNHSDNWATPPYVYDLLNKAANFDFDPCPLNNDITKFDGLNAEWGNMNFVNPPYSLKLKEQFIRKALVESQKGKCCILLLPVSTSTKIFHEIIKPNARNIEFIKGRIPFIGINSKGEYVNWHHWENPSPQGSVHVKNSGMFDSMIVTF